MLSFVPSAPKKNAPESCNFCYQMKKKSHTFSSFGFDAIVSKRREKVLISGRT